MACVKVTAGELPCRRLWFGRA
uniref:Uncharacterized protein n=1 Tax=Arundo donax TaxID=35708 RepID=A0A0A9BZM8_ARUDO